MASHDWDDSVTVHKLRTCCWQRRNERLSIPNFDPDFSIFAVQSQKLKMSQFPTKSFSMCVKSFWLDVKCTLRMLDYFCDSSSSAWLWKRILWYDIVADIIFVSAHLCCTDNGSRNRFEQSWFCVARKPIMSCIQTWVNRAKQSHSLSLSLQPDRAWLTFSYTGRPQAKKYSLK